MRINYRPYFILILVTVFIDQLSKYIIKSTFIPGESIQVLGDFIRFTFVYNKGGAFGITFGSYLLYTILSLAAVIILVVYFVKASGKPKIVKLSLALVIGGAIGNIIDRLIYRQVIDFIDVDIIDIIIPPFSFLSLYFDGFVLLRWYTFNVADIAITVSLIGLLIITIFFNKIENNAQIITNQIDSDNE